MQAVEALTRVIALADFMTAAPLEGAERLRPRTESDQEQDSIALAICQAMLNTAIPVARFRAHVSIEAVHSKTSRLGLCEFTISAINIDGIKASLITYMREDLTIHATLWEQRATGADMLSGYQGLTLRQAFREWIREIDQFQTEPTVQ